MIITIEVIIARLHREATLVTLDQVTQDLVAILQVDHLDAIVIAYQVDHQVEVLGFLREVDPHPDQVGLEVLVPGAQVQVEEAIINFQISEL